MTDDFGETGDGPFESVAAVELDVHPSMDNEAITGAVPNDALRDLIEEWKNTTYGNPIEQQFRAMCADELEEVLEDE